MSDQLNFSIFQMELSWEDKTSNLKKINDWMQNVPTQSHIVVLPEMFSTGFSMNVSQLAERMDGETIQWMKDLAIRHKKIIVGSIIIEENSNYYNRLIWVLPNGSFHFYDKAHLFGKAREDQYFQPGEKRVIVQVNGWKIFLQTCYDLRFPVWSRQDKDPYDVIINVANWPAVRSMPWKILSQARAIENLCYMVTCNVCGQDGNHLDYSGDSSVIDYAGNVLWTETNKESIGNVTLEKSKLIKFREDFPFLNDRDNFLIL